MSKVNIYCAGGAGINIGKLISKEELDNVQVYYVDSSESNLRDLGIGETSYLIEDMDGAGKLRSKTYGAFLPEVEAVLSLFKPSDSLNVIISSLSGGTGSIIAPLLAKEMINRGETTIVVGISSQTSVIELENSIKTIQTYNNFAVSMNKPIPMYYCANTTSRAAVDTRITSFVHAIALVCDVNKTSEFDSTDLNHFTNYNLVSKLPVGLSNVTLSINGEEINNKESDKHMSVHTASTILMVASPDTDLVINDNRPEYLAKVVITDPNFGKDHKTSDIRIDNNVGELPVILNELNKSLTEAQDRVRASRINAIEVVDTDDGGMVL